MMSALNAVFKPSVNGSFNNSLFSGGTIQPMHQAASRLYRAATELRGTAGQTRVAKLLDQSPQTVKNWETRGVSADGALLAQAYIGCDANWVLTGNGHMLAGWPFSSELRSAVDALKPIELTQLENVMRAHLGISPISAQASQNSNTPSSSMNYPASSEGNARALDVLRTVDSEVTGSRNGSAGRSGHIPRKRGGNSA